jgi:hypothetical protein
VFTFILAFLIVFPVRGDLHQAVKICDPMQTIQKMRNGGMEIERRRAQRIQQHPAGYGRVKLLQFFCNTPA